MAQKVCLQCGRPGFDPWVRKIPWRRKWQPTPVLLPGKYDGWRSLVGYSPWGHKESDATERLHFTFTFTIKLNYTLYPFSSVQFSSVAQSCPTLCDPMNCSTPGLPVHHQLPSSLKLTSIKSVMPSSHLISVVPFSSCPQSLPA